ncbi:MAG: PSP1 domain-containing protein [Gemmatimonadales bacterium]
MSAVVEVRFKGNRNEYFTWPAGAAPPPAVHDAVIVEVERGQDLGRVSATGDVAERKCARGCGGCAVAEAVAQTATRRVVRRATADDLHRSDELRRGEDDVRRAVLERARRHGLPMKISDAEWQWDRRKLTVYFTAEQRVDFRVLVRELAAQYRTRIELRQIGARDEARRLDGIGRCGRQLCIASWLPEARPVSLSVAKDQNLSLNPVGVSGPCGRLLCCLHYEHAFYVESRQRFPKEGRVLATAAGAERVVAVDIFRERVTLRAEPEGSTRVVGLEQLQRELGPAQEPPRDGDPRPEADAAPSPVPHPPSPPRPRRRGRRNPKGPPS